MTGTDRKPALHIEDVKWKKTTSGWHLEVVIQAVSIGSPQMAGRAIVVIPMK